MTDHDFGHFVDKLQAKFVSKYIFYYWTITFFKYIFITDKLLTSEGKMPLLFAWCKFQGRRCPQEVFYHW